MEMKKLPAYLRRLLVAGVALGGLILAVPLAQGADHLDSPSAKNAPSADLTDLYAWTDAGGERLNLIMNVMPMAAAGAQFSTATQYVFHVDAHSAFGTASAMSTAIVCEFYTGTNIECWARRDDATMGYVSGDASAEAGLTSDDESIRVFAGMRNDPFYFNLNGFEAVAEVARGALAMDPPAFTPTADGCPMIDSATSTSLVTQLMSEPGGGAATDDFAGTNVLSIVMQVDLDLITDADNQIISTWASTHQGS